LPVACLFWDEPSVDPFVAHVLSAPEVSREGRRLTDSAILPHAGYQRLCLDAAASVSPQFGDFFLKTTFLADGVTPIVPEGTGDGDG
jgi:hypothetical protein